MSLWLEYLNLWRVWAEENPDLIEDLRRQAEAHGDLLSDRFASSPINQAHALSIILNETA